MVGWLYRLLIGTFHIHKHEIIDEIQVHDQLPVRSYHFGYSTDHNMVDRRYTRYILKCECGHMKTFNTNE